MVTLLHLHSQFNMEKDKVIKVATLIALLTIFVSVVGVIVATILSNEEECKAFTIKRNSEKKH